MAVHPAERWKLHHQKSPVRQVPGCRRCQRYQRREDTDLDRKWNLRPKMVACCEWSLLFARLQLFWKSAGCHQRCPQLWHKKGTDAQAWQLTSLAPAPTIDGTYRLTIPGGIALDVAGGQLTDGAAAQIYTDNGTGAQAWQFTRQPDGTYTIRNPQSDKYLDVAGASDINGGKVQIWTGNGTCAQKWSLVASGAYYS